MLPEHFTYHCAVLNDNVVYLIGGLSTKSKVLAIDIRTSSTTYKSELKQGHTFPACAKNTGSSQKIVITEGEYKGKKQKSTILHMILGNTVRRNKLSGRISVSVNKTTFPLHYFSGPDSPDGCFPNWRWSYSSWLW